MFQKPDRTAVATNRIRLTGLWWKTAADGSKYLTGDFREPKPGYENPALENLKANEAEAYIGLFGHRVSIFPNTSGSGNDYRVMFSESTERGHEGPRPQMVQVGGLEVSTQGKALKGALLAPKELPNQYKDVAAFSKATLLVTEITTKRSENDADAIMYIVMPTKVKKPRTRRTAPAAAEPATTF